MEYGYYYTPVSSLSVAGAQIDATRGYRSVQSYEAAGGFRPNRLQLIKIDYEYRDHSTGTYRFDRIL